MASNRNKNQPTNDFATYRQIAPEVFSDESLRILIKSKGNDHQAIMTAIENIWHDTPDQQAVGSEWVSASRKKEAPVPTSAPRSSRDTGGRGGDRRRQTAGGRGSGDNRGEKGERDRKKSGVTASSPPTLVAADTPASELEVAKPASVTPVAAAPTPKPVAVATASVVAAAPTGSKAAWGVGTSFVEKMKSSEAEKEKAAVAAAKAAAAAAAVVSTVAPEAKENVADNVDPESADASKKTKSRNRKPKARKSAETEVTEGIAQLDVDAAAETLETAAMPETVITAKSPVANEGADNSFLKLGKWEAPIASAEMFQFGSFGNYANEEEKSAWGKTEETIAVQEEPTWGAATAEQVNLSSALFSNKMPPGIEMPASTTRAPPGLEQNPAVGKQNQNNNLRGVPGNQNKFNKDFQQNQQQQILMQQPILYPQQYTQQPPGIAPGTRNPAVGVTGTANYPYAGFESQAQFLAPAAAPAATAATTTAAQGTVAPNTLQQQQQAQQQQAQQQQQYGAYPSPFYGNPYYNSYYYGQPPNFYNQGGRGLYQQQQQQQAQQQQRPYGSDPYAANPYPDMYQGQFPDAYGTMQQTANANTGVLGSAATGNKAGKAGSTTGSAAVGAQGISQDHNAAHLGNYGYMNHPYGNRVDPQAWQYQQGAQWGAPMFPNAAPQQQAPHLGISSQQPTTNAQRQPGANYNSLSGNRSNTGASANTTQGW